jgi:hypothetical protein
MTQNTKCTPFWQVIRQVLRAEKRHKLRDITDATFRPSQAAIFLPFLNRPPHTRTENRKTTLVVSHPVVDAFYPLCSSAHLSISVVQPTALSTTAVLLQVLLSAEIFYQPIVKRRIH